MKRVKFLVVVIKGTSFSRELLKQTIINDQHLGKFASQMVLTRSDVTISPDEDGNLSKKEVETIDQRVRNEGCRGLFLVNPGNNKDRIKNCLINKNILLFCVNYPNRK